MGVKYICPYKKHTYIHLIYALYSDNRLLLTMTVIHGIEVDDVEYIDNEIRAAICNNVPIEDKLHVIIVVSNPCEYKRRYQLAKDFIRRFSTNEPNCILYVVELAYNSQPFQITDASDPHHLQIRTYTAPLWHKENMINMGIHHLLPSKWKAVAWIDADVEFENTTWAQDTLRVLNGCRDIVQVFSHAVDMNKDEDAMNVFASFGFQYTKRRKHVKKGIARMWHPGYAWACTRRAYEKMGGLFDVSILGSGDNNIAMSIIGRGTQSVNEKVSRDYVDAICEYQIRVKGLRLGYVPGVIRHFFHGSKKNRKYMERWQVLIAHQYSPALHVEKLPNGLLVPTKKCPSGLLADILQYFAERNEDEGLLH